VRLFFLAILKTHVTLPKHPLTTDHTTQIMIHG